MVGEHLHTLSRSSVEIVLPTNGPDLAFHKILKIEPVATLCYGSIRILTEWPIILVFSVH